MATAYTAAYNKALAGSSFAPPFASGALTDTSANGVRDGVAYFASHDITYQLSLQPAPGTWAFRARNGAAIVVGSLVQNLSWRSGPRDCVLQDPDRTNYGLSVSPGLYRTLQVQQVSHLLALDSASSVRVVGFYTAELNASTGTDQACSG